MMSAAEFGETVAPSTRRGGDSPARDRLGPKCPDSQLADATHRKTAFVRRLRSVIIPSCDDIGMTSSTMSALCSHPLYLSSERQIVVPLTGVPMILSASQAGTPRSLGYPLNLIQVLAGSEPKYVAYQQDNSSLYECPHHGNSFAKHR
jgi:hypothetical protein